MAVDVLDARAAATREPALRGRLAGAVLYPDEAFCDPARVRRRRRGGRRCRTERASRPGVEALSLRAVGSRLASGRDDTRAASPADDRVSPPASGATGWLRPAGVRLPLEGGKGYHVDFERDATQPTLPVFLQEAHVTTTPLPGAFRLTGGLDLCGFDMRVDRRRVDALVPAARRAARRPRRPRPVREVWRGLRPCSPDGLPLHRTRCAASTT